VSVETRETLAELERDYKPVVSEAAPVKKSADKFNAVSFLRITLWHIFYHTYILTSGSLFNWNGGSWFHFHRDGTAFGARGCDY